MTFDLLNETERDTSTQDSRSSTMIALLCVIISWNRPEFLKRTLESLFPQIGSLTAR